MAGYSKSTIARLWSKIDRRGPDECWEWSAASSSDGYGRLKVDGRLKLPHRIVYETEVGPIPPGRGHHGTVVRHKCDNPRCCNPAHLEIGSHRDNVRDMHQRGRFVKPKPRLPPATIMAAWAAEGTMREIGAELGLSNSTVSRIKRGVLGAHVTGAMRRS